MALFEELNQQGITVVLVTHEADVAAHAARVISVHDGLINNDALTQRHATNGSAATNGHAVAGNHNSASHHITAVRRPSFIPKRRSP
jgi:putative ABC transport system ATP-binding protein